MGNEYIAHKLEGVLQAGEEGGSEVGERAAMGDLMTHLWLGATLGSGPLKDDPAALATSEHM